MPRHNTTSLRKLACIIGTMLIICVVVFMIYFPGSQTLLAFTLATGIGIADLRARIERVEAKAANSEDLSELERRFLFDLYRCFAKGGRLVAPESSRMMYRYLSRTGEPLALRPDLFTRSRPVRLAMDRLKRKIREELNAGRALAKDYSSESFYMGDPAHFDTFVGLYYGRLRVRPQLQQDSFALFWRAELPWTWPTYAELFTKYRDYHAQSFMLPNARSLVQGADYSLKIDDGLGGYLPFIGIAKPFLAYSEWEEALPLNPPTDHTNG